MKKSTKGILALVMAGVMLLGCGCSAKNLAGSKQGTRYQKYINNIMECCYYGDFAKYVEVCDATKEEAMDSYNSTVEYYACQLMTFNQIDYDYISDEMYEKYVKLAADILKKAKFHVAEGVKVNDNWQVQVDIEPVDINDTTWDEIEKVIDGYNDNLDAIDTSKMTDEQVDAIYIELQEDYAQKVYDVFAAHIATMGYKEKISKIVIISTDSEGLYGIADDDWNDIDDIVVDMKGRL